MSKRLPLGWRRRPLTDCPLCGGEGSIPINLYRCDGAKLNTTAMRGPCGCVIWN